MANLITPAEVAAYLGIAEAAAPTQAQIDAAETLLLRYINRDLGLTERTEYLSAKSGDKQIRVKGWPLVTITDIWVNPWYNFGQNTTVTSPQKLVKGQDYAIYGDGSQGLIEYYGQATWGWGWASPYAPPNGYGLSPAARAANFSWPPGMGNIKVVYTGGYDPIPDDFKIAVAYQSQWMHRTGATAGQNIVSENWGQYGYTQQTTPQVGTKVVGAVGVISPHVAQMVAIYRDTPLGPII